MGNGHQYQLQEHGTFTAQKYGDREAGTFWGKGIRECGKSGKSGKSGRSTRHGQLQPVFLALLGIL